MLKPSFSTATCGALILAIALAHSAFAGMPMVTPEGDGIGVTLPVPSLGLFHVVDTKRQQNFADFAFGIFGAEGDTLIMGDWNGDGRKTRGVVRDTNGVLLWIRDTTGSGAVTYTLFGSSGDTPIVGNFDPVTIRDEIGFTRPDAANSALVWYRQNSNATAIDVDVWGADTHTPVPGNWDGDANNGDELGVAFDNGGLKLWVTQGSGGVPNYAVFGAAGDTPVPGDYTNDGNTNFGVRQASSNVFYLQGGNMSTPLTEVFDFGPPDPMSDVVQRPGNFGQAAP